MNRNKIVTLGASATGKTSVLSRFMSDTFQLDQPSTTGIDWFAKTVEFMSNGERRETKLICFDTSGQERFKALAQAYVQNASVILLVFDVNNPESLDELLQWYNYSQRSAEEALYYLVGNKKDLEFKCCREEISRVMSETRCTKFYEVSAKEGHGVREMFQEIARELHDKIMTAIPSVVPVAQGKALKPVSSCC